MGQAAVCVAVDAVADMRMDLLVDCYNTVTDPVRLDSIGWVSNEGGSPDVGNLDYTLVSP